MAGSPDSERWVLVFRSAGWAAQGLADLLQIIPAPSAAAEELCALLPWANFDHLASERDGAKAEPVVLGQVGARLVGVDLRRFGQKSPQRGCGGPRYFPIGYFGWSRIRFRGHLARGKVARPSGLVWMQL